MLQAAIESEVEDFLAQHADRRDEHGRRQVVRNGRLPSRQILTGAGPLEVSQPRVRDKAPEADGRVKFSPSVLPPYLRRSQAIEELIPWLYLKGVSTGDFSEALQSQVGEQAQGLSRRPAPPPSDPGSGTGHTPAPTTHQPDRRTRRQ